MDEIYIGDYVGRTPVEDLKRLLACLDSDAATGAGAEAELLAALRRDPDNLGEYFRLVAETKISAQGGQ